MATEYESSIKYAISPARFDELMKENKWCDKQLVIHYNNGDRKVRGQFQNKTVISKINILKIDKPNTFIPLTRKHAVENLSSMPRQVTDISRIVVRYVFKQEQREGGINFRIAVERQCGPKGGSCFVSAEVEYPHHYWGNYPALMAVENEMVKLLPEKPNCQFKKLPLDAMFTIPSRKFQSLHSQRVDQFVRHYVHKYDGHKGRIVCNTPNVIVFYDDLHRYAEVDSDLLNSYMNIVFQVEVIPTSHVLVIVDILGGYVGKKLFMPEPYAAIDFISNMTCAHRRIHLPTYEYMTILLQNFVQLDSPSQYPTDGYILISNNRLFKYKAPTIDVRILHRHLYIDSIDQSLDENTYTLDDGVYEVRQESGKYVVLRRRFDRSYTSSVEQFKEFQAELTYLKALNTQLSK